MKTTVTDLRLINLRQSHTTTMPSRQGAVTTSNRRFLPFIDKAGSDGFTNPVDPRHEQTSAFKQFGPLLMSAPQDELVVILPVDHLVPMVEPTMASARVNIGDDGQCHQQLRPITVCRLLSFTRGPRESPDEVFMRDAVEKWMAVICPVVVQSGNPMPVAEWNPSLQEVVGDLLSRFLAAAQRFSQVLETRFDDFIVDWKRVGEGMSPLLWHEGPSNIGLVVCFEE
jgi:hypothetical protein